MLDCFVTVTSLKDSFLLLGSNHNKTRCKGFIISTLGFQSPFFFHQEERRQEGVACTTDKTKPLSASQRRNPCFRFPPVYQELEYAQLVTC